MGLSAEEEEGEQEETADQHERRGQRPPPGRGERNAHRRDGAIRDDEGNRIPLDYEASYDPSFQAPGPPEGVTARTTLEYARHQGHSLQHVRTAFARCQHVALVHHDTWFGTMSKAEQVRVVTSVVASGVVRSFIITRSFVRALVRSLRGLAHFRTACRRVSAMRMYNRCWSTEAWITRWALTSRSSPC